MSGHIADATHAVGKGPRIGPALLCALIAMLGLSLVRFESGAPAPPAPVAEAQGDEARVTLGPGGRDVRLWGELTDGTADRLARLLAAHPGIARIHLTSEGGLVDEGAALGALIARAGLVTYVPDYCVSACTLAFVRGRERLVVAEARLGFHAPYEEDAAGRLQRMAADPERAAYLAAGLEPGFVDAALAIEPDDIWVPDTARLVQARVATGIVDLDRFPDSTLDDRADLAGARAALLRNFPVLRALADTTPSVLASPAAWYLEAYRAGRSEGEVVANLKGRAVEAATRAVAQGEDGAVLALARLLLSAMAQAPDPRACAAIASADFGRAHAVLRAADLRETDAAPSADAACHTRMRAYERALALPRAAAALALRALMRSGPTQEATARP